MSWCNVKLAEVATIERTGIDPSAISAGTLYLGLEHIESGGSIISSQKVANGELASTKYKFGTNHVLYGKLRPYLAKIALPDFEGVCSTDILPINPGPKLDRKFLAYFLRQPSIVDVATSRSTGANLPRLSPKTLAEFEIPLPPLHEQHRIAAILDQADMLRLAQVRLIDNFRSLEVSFLHETMNDEAQSLQSCAFAELAQSTKNSFCNGPFGSNLLTSELQDTGVPVIYIRDISSGSYKRTSTSCVSEKKARELSACAAYPGDLLIAKVGDPPGISAVYPEDQPAAIVTQDVIRFRADTSKVNALFLSAYLNSHFGKKKIERIIVQATRARFSLKDLKALKLYIPCADAHWNFSVRAGEVRRNIARAEAGLHRLEVLFASLQQRAFRGEL